MIVLGRKNDPPGRVAFQAARAKPIQVDSCVRTRRGRRQPQRRSPPREAVRCGQKCAIDHGRTHQLGTALRSAHDQHQVHRLFFGVADQRRTANGRNVFRKRQSQTPGCVYICGRDEFVHGLDHPPYGREQSASKRCEARVLCRAVEDSATHARFQRSDTPTDDRLRGADLGRPEREPAGLADSEERSAGVFDVHRTDGHSSGRTDKAGAPSTVLDGSFVTCAVDETYGRVERIEGE